MLLLLRVFGNFCSWASSAAEYLEDGAAFHVLIKKPIILDLEWAQRRGKFCAMRCGMVPMVFEDVCWQGRACYAQKGSSQGNS